MTIPSRDASNNPARTIPVESLGTTTSFLPMPPTSRSSLRHCARSSVESQRRRLENHTNTPRCRVEGRKTLKLMTGYLGTDLILNDRDCYCSTAISPDTEKDLDESCPLSCPGDATQSCGGNGHFAIYSLETARTSNTAQISDQQSTATSSGAPSALFAAENAQDDQPGKAPIGPTIGVIVGSVLGLILFCALIFIGVKIHRRNQHLKSSGHRRIESQAGILKFGLGGEKEKRQSVAFKHRHRIITDGPFSTMKTPTRENTGTWLFGGSKKAGENLAIGNGSTSGVEWRLDNNALRGSGLSPRTPSAARDNDGMTLPAHQIPETVAQVPTLGERAWHRRRNSVPFPPKAAAGAVGKDKLEPGQGSSSNQHGAESFMKKGDIPTLPVLDFDTPAKGGSVEGRKGGPEPSPPFTLWTIPSTPSLHRLNGMEDGKRGEKEKADE